MDDVSTVSRDSASRRPLLVAGHVCLDVIPRVESATAWQPGQLVEVGAAHVATGGAVANTGVALHRLGVPVELCALVGDDLFGQGIRQRLETCGERMGQGLSTIPGLTTSYTVVLSPPGEDRTFLHCPGANDEFGPEHLDPAQMARCQHLHLGYPPLMRRLYSDDGTTLAEILRRARTAGLSTSVDLSLPDPNTDQGRAPWRQILATALPWVDLFTPSLEELRRMLGEPDDPAAVPELGLVLVQRALDLGTPAVLLKCGEAGLLLATRDPIRLTTAFGYDPTQAADWMNRTLWCTCFDVDVVGTTGSGDTTVAGALGGLWRRLDPVATAISASATGAACCEAADATSGVPDGGRLAQRLRAGWSQKPFSPVLGWTEQRPGLALHVTDAHLPREHP